MLFQIATYIKQRWKLGLNSLRELWYHTAYNSLHFNTLKPEVVNAGLQDPQKAIHWISSEQVEHKSKKAFFMHPPSQVTYRLKVPPRGIFRAFVSLMPEVWGKNSGGVEFNVSVSSRGNGPSIIQKCQNYPAYVPHNRQWMEFRLFLDQFANKEVDLTLSTSAAHKTSDDCAWVIWGNPVILYSGFVSKMRLLCQSTILIARYFLNYLRSIYHGFINKMRSLCQNTMLVARDFLNFLRSLYKNKYMIWSMVKRDMQMRYVGSLLGVLWSIIHPLTQLAIYYFIFSVVLKIKLGAEYEGIGFAIWLVVGQLPWLFFLEVVSRSPGAILEQSSLISKIVFPSEILPLIHLIAALINHIICFIILIGFLMAFGYGISLKIFLIFPFLFITGIFALGISWILSALNVFLRDIGQVIGVVVNVWFFMTPIIYPRHLIPEQFQGLYAFNPILHVVEAYRAGLLGKTDINVTGTYYLLLLSFVTFVLGGLIFKKLKPSFADVL